jgi:predicted deacylase
MASHLRSTLLAFVLGLSLGLPTGSAAAYEPETADPHPVRVEPPAPPAASAEALPAGEELRTEQGEVQPPPSGSGTLVIGYSVEGRPIEVVRFGEGSHSRLIVAGIHGGSEANTTALAHELIAYLQAHPDSVPERLTLYILPELNPDGAARASGPQGRANARGVDLNRNWPAAWQPAWSRSGCWNLGPTTGGERPASEPETMSLIQFVSATGIEALINYHSAALGIFAGGQPPEASSLHLAETLAAVSTYPFPPIDTGCVFTGQLIDWAANNGIAAVDIELHNHRDTDLEENLAILSAFLAWKP